MNHFFKRFSALTLSLLLLACLALPARAAEEEVLTVFFTHDTHDHFYPDAGDRGGYTRLATLLTQLRAQADAQGRATITVDAGDFSMGSFFQTVYATDAPELRALGYMGYDVATFGNHEYDYRPQGLADMLTAAKASGETLPALVQANYNTAADPSAQTAVDAMKDFPVTDYVMVQKGDFRIAVFGLLGVDADECAPMSGMVYEPIADAAQRVVNHIKANEEADFIICLSHTGTDKGEGEDYELARAVSGIDLIVSGHTHTTLSEPIVVNNTVIASCGPYTSNLGRIDLKKGGGFTSYQLIPIDSSIPADPGMTELALGFQDLVNENYLANFGLEYDQVLAVAAQDFTTAQTGDLIGEAYISTVREIEGEDYVPIAFAVAPDGVIRDRICAGEVTTKDAFDILSLGVGADGTPSYPLISVYLTGRDLKNAFEVDASISQIMGAATLYGAGSFWEYNPNRMFLDRLTGCRLSNGSPILDDQLYRVVADLYTGQMLAAVKSKSFGLLSITPLNADGTPVTDFETCILHDNKGSEVKAWYALANYLSAAGDDLTPGAASKLSSPSWNPLKLLFPMGRMTLAVVLIAALLLCVIAAVIYRIATRRKRRALKLAKEAGWRPQPKKKW